MSWIYYAVVVRPLHKTGCRETSSDIPKMMQNFISNVLLNHVLQVALVLAFKLHEKPVTDAPFLARCTVSVHSSDMAYYMQILLGQISEEVKKGIQGMFQISELVPLDPHMGMDHAHIELLKLSRTMAADRGHVGVPVGIVDMLMKGAVQSQSFGIAIYDDALERARSGEGYEMESALFPGRRQVPLTKQACIECVV